MAETDLKTSRDAVLALLGGHRGQRIPCFSGLINVTAPGLDSLNLRLSEVHTDAVKMASAAATTFKLFGFESAVVPLDICVEAGVLGAQVDFREAAPQLELPRVVAPLASSSEELDVNVPPDLVHHERISIVVEAIQILKNEVGQEIAVGAWVPGPYTLATLLIDLTTFLTETIKSPDSVGRVLDLLTDMLIEVALVYHTAGADFITVHEMGGSPGFIGPPQFETLVLPRLQRLLAGLPAPRVLSVCGNTDQSMGLLAEAGADALSVDQLNDLAQSREKLGAEVVLCGNIDPVGTLANEDEPGVRRAVAGAIEAGVDAVWPACDLLPQVPAVNMQALVAEAGRHPRR